MPAAETKRLSVFVLLGIFLFALSATLVLGAAWGNKPFVNEPLHSTLEALGAMSAIVMAIFLLQGRSEQAIEKYSALAPGFLAMGILDGFHAAAMRGQGFVLFHSAASLAGGIGSALIWHPGWVNLLKKSGRRLAWTIAGTLIALGVLAGRQHEWLPAMAENGAFTALAITVNAAAGALFIAAFVYFLADFLRAPRSQSFLFSCLSLLFGLAELEFPFSEAWNAKWWFWHLPRLGAYLVVLYFLFSAFHRMALERNRLIVQLNETLGEVKRLSGLLPICASCKKIRDDQGDWKSIEFFISEHSEAEFSHGLCPDCAKKAFREVDEMKKKKAGHNNAGNID